MNNCSATNAGSINYNLITIYSWNRLRLVPTRERARAISHLQLTLVAKSCTWAPHSPTTMNEWVSASEWKTEGEKCQFTLASISTHTARALELAWETGICNSGSSEKKWIQLIFPLGGAIRSACYRSEEIIRKLFVSLGDGFSRQIERSRWTLSLSHICNEKCSKSV